MDNHKKRRKKDIKSNAAERRDFFLSQLDCAAVSPFIYSFGMMGRLAI